MIIIKLLIFLVDTVDKFDWKEIGIGVYSGN